MVVNRKFDEDYLSFLIRVTKYLDDKMIDYIDWGDSILGDKNTYSRDNLRKSYYVIRKIIFNIQNESCTLEDLDLINLLDEQKEAIYKERVKLRDKLREYRKYLTSEARYENLVDILKESLEDCKYDVIDFKMDNEQKKEEISAILMLSDWHCGSLVDSQFNAYSIDIMKDRVSVLRNKVVNYLINNYVDNLAIEINGDMVEGLIHVSSRVSSEEDVCSEIICVSNVLSDFILSLKPFVKNITVVTTLGNHGRIIPEKKDSIEKENFEMLIVEFLKLKLGNQGIKIIPSYGLDFVKYEFANRIICLSHGHHDKISSVVQAFSEVYHVTPDEIHLGHTHSYQDINQSNIYITVNGSLKGSDDYSLTLRKVNKPSQNLIIYGEDRGIFEIKVD